MVTTTSDVAQGWYLYGITRSGRAVDAPLQQLECCGLAAVVMPVLLSDFRETILQERLA